MKITGSLPKSSFLVLFLLLNIFFSLSVFAANKDPLKIQPSLIPSELEVGQTAELNFHLSLPEGFHAYEDQFLVDIQNPSGFLVGPLSLSPSKTWFDKFSKKSRSGMEGSARLKTTIEVPHSLSEGEHKLKIHFAYQACAETYCLLPMDKTLEVNFKVKASGPPTEKSFTQEIKNISSALKPDQKVTWLTFLFTFLAGVLTSLTPCVFPMIPITLGVLKNTMEKGSRLQLLNRALIYIGGMSLTYSSLGVLAAASGNLFGSLLGQTWFLLLICTFLLIMALSLFDIFEVIIPVRLQTLAQTANTKSVGGVFTAGLLSGLLAAPCVAPVLVGILSLVATQKSYFTGFALLLAYSWGLGLILLLITLSTGFLKALPRSGIWMEKLKYLLGLLVLAAFYYYLHLLLPATFWILSIGFGLILLPFLLKFVSLAQWRKSSISLGIALALIAAGSALIFESTRKILFPEEPVVQEQVAPNLHQFWKAYDEKTFTEALKSGQPTILDFYADWCVACHELAEQAFSEANVLEASTHFNLFRVDATKESPLFDELKTKYKIVGLPTVLFFDSKGNLVPELSLFEFESADKFLKRLQRLK